MNRLDIEEALRRTSAGALVADARLVRRVIKRHCRLPGFGLRVPHARCYTLRREVLLAIATESELGPLAQDLPDHVILLPRADPSEPSSQGEIALLDSLYRAAFHAAVHIEIGHRVAEGKLTPALLRKRIHHVGETEFDEIRLVLRADELLLPPYDDRETYAEFAAVYLELRHFAPQRIAPTFPTLDDFDRIDAMLAADVDSVRLLAACRPEGASPPQSSVRPPAIATPLPSEWSKFFSTGGASLDPKALVGSANEARARGNIVRSAVLRLRAALQGSSDAQRLTQAARDDIHNLATRFAHVIARPNGDGALNAEALADALFTLASRSLRGGLFFRVEARFLYDISRACLAGEKATGTVDVVEWALTFGRRNVMRLLPAAREARILRAIRRAKKNLPRIRMRESVAKSLEHLLGEAIEMASENMRDALRPALTEALDHAGLRPTNVHERVAARKVVEELLDDAVDRGFLSVGLVRDALSRNCLKLKDLTAREFVARDALLAIDARLSETMDGVYRGSEIYLRALQKLSGLAFGTVIGRWLTLHVILPTAASYVLLEGLQHIVNPLLHITHALPRHHHIHFVSHVSFWVLAAYIFGLIHTLWMRRASVRVLRAIGFFFATLFVRLPLRIAEHRFVVRVVRHRVTRAVSGFLLKPGAAALTLTYLTPLKHAPRPIFLSVFAALFAAGLFVSATRQGALAEEIALDYIARALRRIGRRLLPGLFQLIVSGFRRLTDGLDSLIYTVDEALRFREGQSRLSLVGKAILGVGWFVVSYVARFYLNVFIEPQINPLKHFPVVTVSAKIIFPLSPQILPVFAAPLKPVVGAATAKAIGGANIAGLPGMFGFFVWELKENWRMYEATRPLTLGPAIVGHHGETVSRLLKPGVFSGTIPKRFAKLRRAARKGDAHGIEAHREALHHIEEAITRFVERELLDLLGEVNQAAFGLLRVREVALASNRIRVTIGAWGTLACTLAFEEQSGWLVASVADPGFVVGLGERDRIVFENALLGFYKRASVDLVREQIEAAIGAALGMPDLPYDIADEGLVVWPKASYATEVVYALDGDPSLEPSIRGDAMALVAAAIPRAEIMFRQQMATWGEWLSAFEGDVPRRLVRGESILPAGVATRAA